MTSGSPLKVFVRPNVADDMQPDAQQEQFVYQGLTHHTASVAATDRPPDAGHMGSISGGSAAWNQGWQN